MFCPAVVVKRSQDARQSCTTRTRRETVRSASGAVTSSWVTSTCQTRQRRHSMQRAGCTQVTWANMTRMDSFLSLDELKVFIPCRARTHFETGKSVQDLVETCVRFGNSICKPSKHFLYPLSIKPVCYLTCVSWCFRADHHSRRREHPSCSD